MKEGIHINSKVGFSYLKVTFSLLFDSDLCMLQLINTTTANQVWRTIIVLCLFIIQNKMFYSRALVSLLLCMGLHLCFTYNNFFSAPILGDRDNHENIYQKRCDSLRQLITRKKFENTWLEIHGGWVPALSFRSLFLPFCYIWCQERNFLQGKDSGMLITGWLSW